MLVDCLHLVFDGGFGGLSRLDFTVDRRYSSVWRLDDSLAGAGYFHLGLHALVRGPSLQQCGDISWRENVS